MKPTKNPAAAGEQNARALREANKALNTVAEDSMGFVLIPIRLARALRAVATEWIGGVK